MSSGPGSNSTGTQLPLAPPYISRLGRASGQADLAGLQAANAAGGLPSLLNQPAQGIAGLTSDQLANIAQLQGYAGSGNTDINNAESQLAGLTGGPIGSSPDTLAAMRAYSQNVAPTITSSLGATGGGRGGELTAALTQGQTSAYVPLLNQEVSNRENAVGQYGALDTQKQGNTQAALTAAGMPQQIQQDILNSVFNQQQNKAGLIQSFTQGPLAEFGNSLIGSNSASASHSSSGGKF